MREILIVKNKVSNTYVVYDGVYREGHRKEYHTLPSLLKDLQDPNSRFRLNLDKKLGVCLRDFNPETEHEIKQNLENIFKVKYIDRLSKVPKPIPLRDY